MKLNDYLEKKGIKKTFFAKEVGVCKATISKWITGKSLPHPAVIKWISIYTDGLVTKEDFEREQK